MLMLTDESILSKRSALFSSLDVVDSEYTFVLVLGMDAVQIEALHNGSNRAIVPLSTRVPVPKFEEWLSSLIQYALRVPGAQVTKRDNLGQALK
jgi:hypothetical protein